MTQPPLPLLPDGFLWGTATSAHQIEGDNVHNDWWAFERHHRSGAAAKFAEHFSGDLDKAREMGTNTFRFSLEWSRVEPRPDQHDEAGWRYYDALVDACLERGLAPMITLLHFTLPRWAGDAGAWLNPDTRAAFGRFTQRVVDRYGDRVRLWTTINEPNVQTNAGYIAGLFPPGKRLRPDLGERATFGLLGAHADAWRIIHETCARRFPQTRPLVGPAPHFVDWRPSPWDVGGLIARMGRDFNWAFLDAIETGTLRLPTLKRDIPEARGTADFIGVNYYMSLPGDLRGALQFAGLLRPPSHVLASDLGWPIEAAGLHRILIETTRRYNRPIYITENGLADALDVLRADFIGRHVQAMRRAVAEGADVRGYYHWSLIDNFEWHQGYGPRFGLIEIDYATQARRVRHTAGLYRAIIERRGALPDEDAAAAAQQAGGQR